VRSVGRLGLHGPTLRVETGQRRAPPPNSALSGVVQL
jgi:hypothetical protein